MLNYNTREMEAKDSEVEVDDIEVQIDDINEDWKGIKSAARVLLPRKKHHQIKKPDSFEPSTVSNGLDESDSSLVNSFKQKLLIEPQILRRSSGNRNSCCIHRVAQCLGRASDEKAYSPQVVSIGPFHRSNSALKAMEEHKWNYLSRVLSQTARQDIGLEAFLTVAKALEEQVRDCYSETINIDRNAFVEMMVLDGCFVIELLCKATGVLPIDASDPIFNTRWILPLVKTDLLMLENQLPFFLLQRLFNLMNVSSSLTGIVLSLMI